MNTNAIVKKIAILGSNSFIARSIKPLLEKRYEVDSFTRQELNLLNLNAIKNCFSRKRYDFVINCAISGQGRLLKEDGFEDFYNNCLIIENLLYLSNNNYFGKLIQFSSGAGNNRKKDIIDLGEYSITEPPTSVYSLAKYICNRRIEKNDKVINIRIFNVFGPLEKDNRFIKSCIIKCMNGEPIEIWGGGNCIFDFFYVKDLFILIDDIIAIDEPNFGYFEINAVYDEKYTLFQVADKIRKIVGDTRIIVDNEKGINKHYYGNGIVLKNLNLKLEGLVSGIEETYKCLKEEKK